MNRDLIVLTLIFLLALSAFSAIILNKVSQVSSDNGRYQITGDGRSAYIYILDTSTGEFKMYDTWDYNDDGTGTTARLEFRDKRNFNDD